VSKIRKYLCLVALGPAREQLATDLVNAVARRGCSVAECRIAPLGDHFSAALMLTGDWSAMARMESALPGLAEHMGLMIHYHQGQPMEDAADFRPYSAEIIAPQQPHLLSELLGFFTLQGTRIVEVSAQAFDSGLTGARMSTIHLALHVPMTQYPQALRDSFMDLCDDLHADGLLDPVKT